MQLELFFFTLHVFQFFYLRINKLNVRNNIIDISSFQTGLKDLFRPTGFYFKSKVIEGSNKRKNIYFFIFGHFFSKCTFAKLCCFFRLVDIQSTQFFNGSSHFNIHVFDEAFFQNAYGHQTFQGGDMLRGALTHKYAWYLNEVVLWVHPANKIHISTAEDVSTPH